MTELATLINIVTAFEQYLKPPEDENTLISTSQILHSDELEQLNEMHLKVIKDWGYLDFLIPHSLGGKLCSLQGVYLLLKVLSRRDLTLAIAVNLNMLASLPTWIAGSEELKKRHAQKMREGKIFVFALTEQEHGSDLSATECYAQQTENEWIITGEKWCINYATLGDIITILCRTHDQGGPLGFSLFYLDKAQLNDEFTPLPKILTHGVRGLDISGFQLKDAKHPYDSLIGSKGQGLTITYKTLTISRILCSALAVGSSDTALRLAITFSLERKLYGKKALDIPVVYQRLLECFCLQIIQDCISFTVVRAATLAPQYVPLWSALIKYFAPTLAKDIVEQCSVVLGARGYLRENNYALMQKIKRDIEVVGLFDGSSEVNLYLLANTMLSQAQQRKHAHLDIELLEIVFNFNEEIPPFDAQNIFLMTQKADPIMVAVEEMDCPFFTSYRTKFKMHLDDLDKEILEQHQQGRYVANSLNSYKQAETYCWLFAAHCLLHSWHFNQQNMCPPLQNPNWMQLSLEIILKKIAGGKRSLRDDLYNSVKQDMLWYTDNQQLFSMLSIPFKG
jgi:alkylation response protein AidB-like acyl-CoA dehydrogenase